jgi:HAD superfamily hydrolase (TIGR01549 family)
MIATKGQNQPAVVFDFMGVVFKEGMVLSNLLVPMFRPSIPHKEIRRRYRDFVIGEIGSDEFWAGMVSDKRQAEKEYLDRFELADGFEVIFDLKQRYQLAVLSEVPAEWGDYLVRKFELDRVFDVIVLSGRVGVTKPDIRIFRMILEKLGRDRDYAFIDDNHENLAVASTLGWRTIWMNHSSRFQQTGYKPDVTIDGLGELRPLLLESPPQT